VAVFVRRTVRALAFAFGASPARAVVVTALSVLAGAAPVAIAWTTRGLVDGVAGTASARTLLILAAVLLAIMMVSQAVPTLSELVAADLGRRVEMLARDQAFEKVNSFGGLRYFEDPRFHDHLRLALEAGGHVPMELLRTFTTMAQAVVTLAGFLVALVTIDWRVAVLVLLAAAPQVAVELRLGRDRFALRAELSPAERLQFLYENLQTQANAAKEIRLFGLGEFFKFRMLGELGRAQRATRRLDVRTAKSRAALDALTLVPIGISLLFAAWAAGRREIGPGDLVLFLGALTSTTASTGALAAMAARLNELSLAVGRFHDLMGTAPDVSRDGDRDPGPLQVMELRDVWFRYRPDLPWVLAGVNFTIRAGESVGLVGPNGAGKSTLVKLLCRLYDPERGQVLWNGVDLRDLGVDALRRRMGSVFQDFVSYDMSVRDNIGIGDLDHRGDDVRLRSAAGHVGLAETIDALPYGLDTHLSRMFMETADESDDNGDQHEAPSPARQGTFLSGGQWQRLAIARMMMRSDRDLLILDEPSSGLDPQAEHDLHRVVDSLTVGRARVLVSHRLNTVRMADRIVVLDRGVVIEEGRHELLMGSGGSYAHLFELQRAGYLG